MSLDITTRINKAYNTLSKSHKKIANAILNEYETVGFMTATKFGQYVSVSESTVVRFAIELGFEGYSDFQQSIKDLIKSKLTPNQRIELTKTQYVDKDVLNMVMEADIAKIKHTQRKIDKKAFDSAIEAMLSARNIYIMGARSAEPIARILFYNLSLIFDNIKFVNPSSSSEVLEQMYSIGNNDVLFAFSFPRYSSTIVKAAKYAKSSGAKVIVCTDSESAPIASYSDFVLAAESDMASFMDSLVAPLSIINAIIVEIAKRREADIVHRFERLEKIWDEYEVYTKH